MLFPDASAVLAMQGTVKSYEWSVPRAAVSFGVSSASTNGLVRRVTDDSYVAVPPLFLVAETVGAPTFDDRARLAVARVLQTQLAGGILPTVESVVSALADADDLVRAIGEEVAATTMAGIALVRTPSGEPNWLAFTIGESRVYRWGGGRFELLTHAPYSPGARDAEAESVPDLWLFPFAQRDRFLLGSAGLAKQLGDIAIGQLVAHDDGTSLADRLVLATLAAGATATATAVVVDALSTYPRS